MQNAPSVKRLIAAFNGCISAATARQIRDIIHGRADLDSYLDKLPDYMRSYSGPELAMEVINLLIDGFGVEAIRGRYVDHYHQDIQATFVNTGDTYGPTILYDHETGRFSLTTWGDWVEKHEHDRQLV